jgi:hypothetical protein
MKKNKICVFTSVNAGYLDKAITLGRSILSHDSELIDFYILLSENPKKYPIKQLASVLDKENIKILLIEQLNIPDFEQYIFKRTIVELCTAVKGRASVFFSENKGYEKVVYLDPDIYVFSTLSSIYDKLNDTDIVLIPHQNRPATIRYGVDAELTSLQFGVYNLGFFAFKKSINGAEFSRWWAKRLDDYCYDDREKGLFTDQKWCDLVPALFDGVTVLREYGYNSAPWNTHTGKMKITYGDGRVFVEDRPLVFFHFSSFDSGAGLKSCQEMGKQAEVQSELFLWYENVIKKVHKEFAKFITEWTYGLYDDGSKIKKGDRVFIKNLTESGVSAGNPFSMMGRLFIEVNNKNVK